MRSVLFLFLLSFSLSAKGQISKEYIEFIKQGNAFYDAKDYKHSAEAYTKAFAANGGKGTMDDRYNAACTWALAGNADSAFFQLERIAIKANYTDLGHLTIDPDLESIHADKRWIALCNKVRANKEKAEIGLEKPLVALLDTVFANDQMGRMQLENIAKQYGNDSKEVRELWKIIGVTDSIDLVKVQDILDTRGWLGPDVVGPQGSQALFLVIQHADIATQEKYVPMMREAVRNGKAQGSALALLEDRVALRRGKKQIYGSQIGMYKNEYYISPMEDPDHVDARRAEVGLQPLAEYVQHWNLKWDVATYKKQLPEIEKREKEMQDK